MIVDISSIDFYGTRQAILLFKNRKIVDLSWSMSFVEAVALFVLFA